MKEKILKLTLALIGILITAVALILMPYLASTMARSLKSFSFLRLPGLALIYLSLAPFYISLFQGWKLVDLVYGQEIFTHRAIGSLNIIRRCTFLIFVLYFLAFCFLLVLRVPMTSAYLTIMILALAALAFSLSLSILIRLVKIAKGYKDENELTI